MTDYTVNGWGHTSSFTDLFWLAWVCGPRLLNSRCLSVKGKNTEKRNKCFLCFQLLTFKNALAEKTRLDFASSISEATRRTPSGLRLFLRVHTSHSFRLLNALLCSRCLPVISPQVSAGLKISLRTGPWLCSADVNVSSAFFFFFFFLFCFKESSQTCCQRKQCRFGRRVSLLRHKVLVWAWEAILRNPSKTMMRVKFSKSTPPEATI